MIKQIKGALILETIVIFSLTLALVAIGSYYIQQQFSSVVVDVGNVNVGVVDDFDNRDYAIIQIEYETRRWSEQANGTVSETNIVIVNVPKTEFILDLYIDNQRGFGNDFENYNQAFINWNTSTTTSLNQLLPYINTPQNFAVFANPDQNRRTTWSPTQLQADPTRRDTIYLNIRIR